MNTREARLRVLHPVHDLMAYIEQRYQDLENGRATPEQALPMIRAANKQIEERMLPDDLQIATLDWLDGDDRYRLKHFTARLS